MAEDLVRRDPLTRLREYVAEVRSEMRRVTWPSKQEIYGTTVMVVVTTFFFGAFFMICDKVFGSLMLKIWNHLTHRG